MNDSLIETVYLAFIENLRRRVVGEVVKKQLRDCQVFSFRFNLRNFDKLVKSWPSSAVSSAWFAVSWRTTPRGRPPNSNSLMHTWVGIAGNSWLMLGRGGNLVG